MTGYSDTGLFGVGKTLTRGELATILWRNACPDEAAAYDPAAAKDTTGIAGSADGQFYTAAANWAVANKAITGIVREDGSLDFAATEDVTFEQLVTILARVGATPDEVAAAGSDLSLLPRRLRRERLVGPVPQVGGRRGPHRGLRHRGWQAACARRGRRPRARGHRSHARLRAGYLEVAGWQIERGVELSCAPLLTS